MAPEPDGIDGVEWLGVVEELRGTFAKVSELLCNGYERRTNLGELKRSFLGVVFDVESDYCL